MPRIDFKLWDRVYIMKLICTTQMTYSSFVVCVYVYLLIMQSYTTDNTRKDIMTYKWSVIGISILEFGLGTLLAFAANTPGIRGKKQIVLWLILETILVPVSICILMQLYYRIINSKERYSTDPHYWRTNIAQVCFLLCQYIFMTYVIDFLTYKVQNKEYDPSIRPESVYAPTDPQITTTESRHIRMSQSFLWQPSSSKAFRLSDVSDEESESSSIGKSIQSKWSSHENIFKVDEKDEEKVLSETTTDDDVQDSKKKDDRM